MYPRARLDALTDGIFAVAMTLLVLDLRLPEEFHPHDARELLDGLRGLLPKFLPYLLSFMVLGLRWLSSVQVRAKTEGFGRGYFKWWLIYILLITCVPATRRSSALRLSGCCATRRTSSGTIFCATGRFRSPCWSAPRCSPSA